MTTIPVLRRAVEQRYGCVAMLREIVHVEDPAGDGSRLDGPVVAFSLVGCPTASVAYAWWELTTMDAMVHVALHRGEVDSPSAAVQRTMLAGRSDDQAP